MATKDYTNYVSETSDRIYVGKSVNAIDALAADAAKVSVRTGQGSLTVRSDAAAIEVYDLQGRSVARAEAGRHTFRLAPAVYLVRVAGKTVKVVVP